MNAGEIHLGVGLDCLWRSSLCVNDLALKTLMSLSTAKMPPSEPAQEEEESGPLNLSTWPITLSRVALNNINIKIDDTTVSVLDFTSGLAWQEKT